MAPDLAQTEPIWSLSRVILTLLFRLLCKVKITPRLGVKSVRKKPIGSRWGVHNSEKVRVLTPKGNDFGANLEPKLPYLDIVFFAFSAKLR